MKSHELARLLLSLPDLPIATYAHNHTYTSGGDSFSHGSLKIALLKHYSGDHIVLGNISKKNINAPNWYITDVFVGQIADEWPSYS